MENINNLKGGLSRRKFLGNTAAIAAFSMIPASSFGKGTFIEEAEAGATPDSKFGGVQIGAITYSWRSMPGGCDNIIKYCVEAGISSIELMSGDVESDAGAPAGPPQRRQLTPEQQAQVDKFNQDLKQWRLTVPMTKFTELGKKFNDAGIKIHIVKFSPARWSDEEIDYAFKAAKAMDLKVYATR